MPAPESAADPAPETSAEARRRFLRHLNRTLVPVLRADGFVGSGATHRRFPEGAAHVVNVQGSVYGGRCYVNLGVHFPFLPPFLETDLARLPEYGCAFRSRLHGPGDAERWWEYGADDDAARAAAERIARLYADAGRAWFARFAPFPDVFLRTPPEAVDAGDLSGYPVTSTRLDVALTLARIMAHLGRDDLRRAYAAVGLRHLGHALTLRDELERLRDGG